MGKHSKRITCGSWSNQNILALGGDDKLLSLSTEDGDLIRTVPLRDTPSDMHFAEMKTDERIPGENTASSAGNILFKGIEKMIIGVFIDQYGAGQENIVFVSFSRAGQSN